MKKKWKKWVAGALLGTTLTSVVAGSAMSNTNFTSNSYKSVATINKRNYHGAISNNLSNIELASTSNVDIYNGGTYYSAVFTSSGNQLTLSANLNFSDKIKILSYTWFNNNNKLDNESSSNLTVGYKNVVSSGENIIKAQIKYMENGNTFIVTTPEVIIVQISPYTSNSSNDRTYYTTLYPELPNNYSSSKTTWDILGSDDGNNFTSSGTGDTSSVTFDVHGGQYQTTFYVTFYISNFKFQFSYVGQQVQIDSIFHHHIHIHLHW